jgi:peptide/nickel transport system substrate-binding protein
MRSRRFTGSLAVTLVLLGAVVVPLGAQWPGRREIRIGVAGVPATLEPAQALDGAPALIARQVFDTLVSWREGSTDIEPALAVRWSASRDGLVWSFTLRDNVRFHDGTALTAAEVAASFDRHLRDPSRPSAVWSALLGGVPGVIREVRAIDPRTLQIVLVEPYAPLLTVLAHPGFGVARAATGPDGAPRLVGTGPFRVLEASSGRLVVEAVAGHWAGSPRADRLVFLEVPDEAHAEAELAQRGLDIWFPSAPPTRNDGVLSLPGLTVGYLAFQTEKEPFSRKKVRQAVAAAIDPALLGLTLGRAAVPLQSFLPPGTWARREVFPILGATRPRVASLLAEGGWPRGYTATLLGPSALPGIDVYSLAEMLKVALQTADIPLRVRLEPEAAYREARTAGQHDMVLAEADVAGGDAHLLLFPLSTGAGPRRGPQTPGFGFYRNPRLDDILLRAAQLSFRPERQRLYQRAQAMLAEEVPWLPLYVRLLWAVARPEVRGLRLHPTGLPRLTAVSLEATPGLP